MALTVEQAARKLLHAPADMVEFYKNIYLSVTGRIEKTELSNIVSWVNSRLIITYRKVKGVVIETVIDPDTHKVLYVGEPL